jgi:hypothetical protein
MPVQYVIHIHDHIVRTTFRGTVTCREVAEHDSRLRSDPAFDPDFSELVTFRDDPDIQLTYLEWRSLSDVDPFSRSSRRAFVVQSHSAVYGVVRMYQIAKSDAPNIKIFETGDEALSWLSAPKRLAEGR